MGFSGLYLPVQPELQLSLVDYQLVLGLKNGVFNLQSTPVAATYLSFVILSPVWRRFMPPLELRKPMVVYNFVCALASLYSVVYIVMSLIPNWPQSLFDTTEHPYVKHAMYVYWMTKIIELLDTVIMILRHRTRQISFLHVYHHTSILLIAEYGYVRGARPAMGVICGLNSLVHVFLYYYYGQTARRPSNRPMWKKALTELQLTQFVIGVVHQTVGYTYYNFCLYGIIYEMTMIVLFSNFYYHAYVKSAPQQKVKKVE